MCRAPPPPPPRPVYTCVDICQAPGICVGSGDPRTAVCIFPAPPPPLPPLFCSEQTCLAPGSCGAGGVCVPPAWQCLAVAPKACDAACTFPNTCTAGETPTCLYAAFVPPPQ